MADDVKLKIKVEGDTANFNTAIKNSNKEVKTLSDSVGSIKDKIPSVASLAVAAFAAVGSAIYGAAKQASKFEDFSVQFETLTGNADNARRMIEKLYQFSASTPFEFENIANATKKLLGFGFVAEEIPSKLKMIGDVAAALGVPIEEVSMIFGKVAAKGRLMGEELLQIQEKGIGLGPALAKTMGVAEKSITTLVSQGKVSFKDFENAFKSLSSEGGIAFNGMEKQSKTLSGMLSTVSDNIALLANSVGQSLLPYLKDAAGYVNKFVVSLNDLVSTKSDEKLAKNKKELEDIDKLLPSLAEKLQKMSGDNLNLFSFWAGGDKNQIAAQIQALAQKKNNILKENATLEKQIYEDSSEFTSKKEAERTAKMAEEEAKRVASKGEVLGAIKGLETQSITELSTMTDDQYKAELEKLDAANKEKEDKRVENMAIELENKGLHVEALAEIENRRVEDEKSSIEKILKNREIERDRKKKIDDQITAYKRTVAGQQVDIANNAADLMVAISGKESKASFVMRKAAALAQVIINRGLALSAVPAQTSLMPYPTNLVAAAQMTGYINANSAIQVATIAASTIQGFADGGLVGGLSGTDRNPAMLSRGELVAPQKNFDEVIGSVRAMREAQAISSGGASARDVNVTIGFNDNAFDIIEKKVLERRVLGIGAI